MPKKILTASLLAATVALGSAAPALAASPAPATVGTTVAAAAPMGDEHTIGKCSPGLLFDSNKLTCDYAGLINSDGLF
ncbi:carbohydrate-binding module family 14 protein [Streptomyces sp. NBC_01116]|uniref:carbohydrate-binding module family 14 protein n=1 Tax=Streptomyces sp. NBC_01116 TaxID=2903752 RepID=UPI0032529CB9